MPQNKSRFDAQASYMVELQGEPELVNGGFFVDQLVISAFSFDTDRYTQIRKMIEMIAPWNSGYKTSLMRPKQLKEFDENYDPNSLMINRSGWPLVHIERRRYLEPQ